MPTNLLPCSAAVEAVPRRAALHGDSAGWPLLPAAQQQPRKAPSRAPEKHTHRLHDADHYYILQAGETTQSTPVSTLQTIKKYCILQQTQIENSMPQRC